MTQCSALNSALSSKGYDNATLASRAGLSKDRVDSILAGSTKPTQNEYNLIAQALGLSNNHQHNTPVVV